MSKTIASYCSSDGRIAVEAMLSRRWYERKSIGEVCYPLISLRHFVTRGHAGIEIVILWLAIFVAWQSGPGGGR